MSARAFFSYAHSDNENSDGFVIALAQALKRAYQLLSGEELLLFVDRDEDKGIQWGEEWRAAIDSNLANASFFLPVLSPTYLMRPECRREFEEFQRAARTGKQERLILPILLVDFLSKDQKEDEIAQSAAALQWVDWSELYLLAPDSSEYRTEVQRMAKRLLSVQAEIDAAIETGSSPGGVAAVTREGEESDDEEGELDRAAKAEELVQGLKSKIEGMSEGMVSIGKAVSDATPELKGARSFSAQLAIFQKLSRVLTPTIDEYSDCVREYVDTIIESDPGIREVLRMAREARHGGDLSKEADDANSVAAAVKAILDFAQISIANADNGTAFLKQVTMLENKARSLRPAMRKLRTATAMLVSTRPIFTAWIGMEERALASGS